MLCFECGKDHGDHSKTWIELKGSYIVDLLKNDIETFLAYKNDLLK